MISCNDVPPHAEEVFLVVGGVVVVVVPLCTLRLVDKSLYNGSELAEEIDGVDEEIVLIVILSVSGVIDDEDADEDFLAILCGGGGVLYIVAGPSDVSDDGDSERRRPLGRSGGLP